MEGSPRPSGSHGGLFGWVGRHPKSAFWLTAAVALVVGIGIGGASAGTDHSAVDQAKADAKEAHAQLAQVRCERDLLRLKGRSIVQERRSIGPMDDEVEVVLDDGEVITVPAQVLALYRNATVRKRARTVIEPLELDGVNRLRVVHDRETTVSIGTQDLPSFDPPPMVEELVSDLVVEGMMVSIAAPSFTENKWRLSDGTSTFPAAMDDAEFRQEVEAGRESFRAGDALRVNMRIIQSRSLDGSISTERRVVRVVEHIPRPTQLRLDAQGDDSAHAA
jgi:hypothetical protein